MLTVKNLHAYYGKSHILQGIDLNVNESEIISLLGRNGVGRSTVIKTIMGLVRPVGTIVYNGTTISSMQTHEIAQLGIGYIPENRDVFPDLTVMENIEMGRKSKDSKNNWDIEELFQLFPNLANRREVHAGALSGGEQQMLTICRCLMGNPSLIMIDEPTEGLSPQMVENVKNLLNTIVSKKISIILVEQKLTIALDLSSKLYVMGHGKIVFEGTPKDMQNNTTIQKEWLEV